MNRPVPSSNNGDWVIGSIHFILFIKLFLLGWKIQWIVSDNQSSSQQNLPRVRLYDCSFRSKDITSIEFILSGLMSLIRCDFALIYKTLLLRLEKSQYEPEVTGETLGNFKSRDDHNRIEIIQTKINVWQLHIGINNAAKRLKMENVDLDVFVLLHIYIGEKGHDSDTVSVFELEVINCRVSVDIKPSLTFINSFAKFRFESTVFDSIYFNLIHYVGLASYVFDKCTFTQALPVDIQRVIDFKIIRSTINVPHDCGGTECYVRFTGVDGYNLMSDRELSKIFFNRISVTSFYSIVDIESTSFQGGYGPFFIVHRAKLRFSKTVFHIQSHRTRHEYLIDF